MPTPWYMDAERYTWFADHVDISEEQYLLAVSEVLDIFPLENALAYTNRLMQRENGLSGPFSLHPAPFRTLARHPVLTFMSGKVRDNHILAEVVNLGRDLCATKGIPRVASIRRDLRDLEQYIGRLFELEVLAWLVRADMSPTILGTPDFSARLGETRMFIEARHRGVSFGRAVTEGIMLGLAFHEFGELSVRMPNLGSSGESVAEVTEKILNSIAELMESDRQRTLVTDGCEICHRSEAGPRCLSVHFGKESYDADIANLIRYTLQDKEKQLASVPKTDGFRALALDLRSLFPALPPAETRESIAPGWLEYYEPKIEAWRSTVLVVTQSFLESTETTDGVLIWWKNAKGMWPGQIKDQFWNRDTVQVVEGGRVVFADQPWELREALNAVAL